MEIYSVAVIPGRLDSLIMHKIYKIEQGNRPVHQPLILKPEPAIVRPDHKIGEDISGGAIGIFFNGDSPMQ